MMTNKTPKLLSNLLLWFGRTDLVEELLGDLEESFHQNCENHGARRARWRFRLEVIKLFRPSVIRKPRPTSLSLALFNNYLTISFRNLKRHSLFSFINIISLSIAMSSGLLVIGMITDLLKFDEFHEHKDEVYRVVSDATFEGRTDKIQATSPFALGDELTRDIPEIELTKLGRRLAGLVEANNKSLDGKGIYADEHFFDFLTFELLKGNPSEALKNPFTMVISESFANKVFEELDPVGQTLSIEHVGDFIITGLAADPPQFSHIQFDFIASITTTPLLATKGLIRSSHDAWENLDMYYNYLYIPDNEQKQAVLDWLTTKGPTFYKDPTYFSATFDLQKLNEIVPGPNMSDSIGPKMLYLPIIILSVIASAILLSAIFNYTNLSMARSLRRAREVGIRKLNGAKRGSILAQFAIEACVFSLLSLVLGVMLFLVLRGYFIRLLPRAEEMVNLNLTPELFGYFFIYAWVAGLIAGIGPALFFARLTSLNALRSGKMLKSLSRINLRKILIAAQFTLSIIFILAVVITNKQYTYSLNMDMGFTRGNTLNIHLQENDPELVKTELLKHPEVSDITFSSFTLGIGQWYSVKVVDQRNMDTLWVHHLSIDHSYLDQKEIPIIAGRGFREAENRNLEMTVMVNETLVQNFGFANASAAIGQRIDLSGQSVEIIGVVKDFIYANLEETIKSLVIRNQRDHFQVASVALNSKDIIATIQNLEKTWEQIDDKHQFDARFYDDQVEGYYQYLTDFMKIFGYIGFLAVTISCLGLLGIAVYSTETRMKEIGVRKTFGASEFSLVLLLSKGFFKIVCWAIVIGTPLCYLLFDRVILEENVYRHYISFGEIGISILFLLSISLLTVFSQTWSAARRNPALVLRDE
ncbi:MAG: ABC transporter permease [Cytophagales bacterium]|nr:ABC transporter permease [Cytophagales bacterium]